MSRFKVTTPPDNIPEDRSSILSLYRKKYDKNLFNAIDAENIKLSGSKIFLYKYIPSEDVDEIYMESRQKTIAPEPIELWAHYDPRPIEEGLSEFGVQMQYEQTFTFNKSYVEGLVGRGIIPGDILKSQFQNAKFEVYEVQEDSFESYGIYHLLVHAKLLRDTMEIHNESNFDMSPRIGGKI